MKNKSSIIAALLLIFLCFNSCSTLSSNLFLVKSLDKEEKSEILTKKGIGYYEQQLTITENYLLVPMAKKYFKYALVFNPENIIAQQYMEKLNIFIDEQVARNLKSANKYFSKEDKSEQDIFNLCYFTQRAYEISPNNYDVVELKMEIRNNQDLLIEEYIKRGNEILIQLESDSVTDSEDTRELYFKAYDNFGRILLLDPMNSKALKSQENVKNYLQSIAEMQIQTAETHIKSNEFSKADLVIQDISYISGKVDDYFKEQIDRLNFESEFQKARYYYSINDINRADYYIRRTVAMNPEPESIAFRDKLRVEREKKDSNTKFETLIENIDILINEGQLITAAEKLSSLRSRTSETAKLNRIANRDATIKSKIPSLYQIGVKKYKEDLFKDAIASLEIVIILDAGYEQAVEYLEKARAKQKVLDSF